MENRINQVMELANGKKYVVMKQAIYKDNNYYVSALLTDDEEDIIEEFVIFQEIGNGVKQVKDANLIELICKHVGLSE